MVEDSNQVDTQAAEPLSLREELAKQLKAQEVTEDASTPDEVSEEVSEESTEEGTEEDGAQDEPQKEVTEEVEKAEETDVPNNWNKEEKQAFEDIPDEITTEDGTKISLKAMKDVVLHRNEELLKAFMEKSREATAAKKGGEQWNNLLDPYKPQLTAAGMEPQQWIGTILKDVHRLQQNPKAVIKELIGAYKVSASDLGIKPEQSEDQDLFHGEDDPKVTKLETTVTDLRAEIDAMRNEGIQQKNQSVQDELTTFQGTLDGNGNLAFPHFNEAREEMGILIQTGKAKTLEEAYKKSPTVRSKGLEVVRSPEDNKLALKKAREEAAKAKKAGKTIKTRSGQTPVMGGLSIRDTLKANMRAQQ